MDKAETALLQAVRNRLRSENGYSDEQCEIEFDELAPGTVGDLYVVVLPGGWQPGPRHKTSGGVNDLVYGLDVTVIKRIRHVPRDRTRDVFLNNLDNLNDEIDAIYNAIDFVYAVNDAANTIITNDNGSTEGFVEPLKFQSVERRPRQVNPELFAAQGTQAAGLARTISFHGARRITTK